MVIWSLTCLGYLLFISTRFHYTVDVLVGSLFTLLVFHLYHSIIHSPSSNFKVLMWLEANSDDVVSLEPLKGRGGGEEEKERRGDENIGHVEEEKRLKYTYNSF